MCPSSSSTWWVRRRCAGTSSRPSQSSTRPRPTTPMTTICRSRAWKSPTSASSARDETVRRQGRDGMDGRSRHHAQRLAPVKGGSRMFQTEVEFTLPLGYVDTGGTLHRAGVMRRATAADEILPLRDQRVQANPAYLVVILLSRVITHLEGVEEITPRTIEGLFATDLAYLQNLYNQLNGHTGAAEGESVRCPQCQ